MYKGVEKFEEHLKKYKKRLFLALFLCGLALFADLYTKHLVIKNLERGEVITVLPGFLNIVHVKNRGMVFGIFNSEGHPAQPFLHILSSVVLLLLFYLLISTLNNPFENAIFSVLLGSALGNLWERFYRGEVTDFIDMHIGRYHWPSYNLADAFITIGVCLLVLKAIILSFKSKG